MGGMKTHCGDILPRHYAHYPITQEKIQQKPTELGHDEFDNFLDILENYDDFINDEQLIESS